MQVHSNILDGITAILYSLLESHMTFNYPKRSGERLPIGHLLQWVEASLHLSLYAASEIGGASAPKHHWQGVHDRREV